MPPIPITIVTGFLGSGKTTLILNLLPQLPPTYKLALLKNEFGDLAIDSELASAAAISGVRELLNGCICCNLVGQLSDALATLHENVQPDRIVIETSGSAFPATLAMEVNRLGRETGSYVLDGVIVVIDVENWRGYDDTSFTARLQAKYTDLMVFNKWEGCSERVYEDCVDRVGDLEVQVAQVKSERGRVDAGVLLGLDSALARGMEMEPRREAAIGRGDGHEHKHESEHGHENGREHAEDHQSEVEVLSVTLSASKGKQGTVDLEALATLLLSAPKDEVYRVKAIVAASRAPAPSDGSRSEPVIHPAGIACHYILNWAFGRWTFTPLKTVSNCEGTWPSKDAAESTGPALRMTIICARLESEKWKKRIIKDQLLRLEASEGEESLKINRIV